MKKLRKLTLLTLALSLVLCLTGCDLFGGGVTKEDAVDYVKAQMDVIYKGEFQGYLDLVADSTGISDELSGHRVPHQGADRPLRRPLPADLRQGGLHRPGGQQDG